VGQTKLLFARLEVFTAVVTPCNVVVGYPEDGDSKVLRNYITRRHNLQDPDLKPLLFVLLLLLCFKSSS
jgi:hypothetical protein